MLMNDFFLLIASKFHARLRQPSLIKTPSSYIVCTNSADSLSLIKAAITL